MQLSKRDLSIYAWMIYTPYIYTHQVSQTFPWFNFFLLFYVMKILLLICKSFRVPSVIGNHVTTHERDPWKVLHQKSVLFVSRVLMKAIKFFRIIFGIFSFVLFPIILLYFQVSRLCFYIFFFLQIFCLGSTLRHSSWRQ